MNSSDFYTPKNIPNNIKVFDSEIKQLGVGKAGKNGCLKLVLQNDKTGKTIIVDQYSEVPLQAQRALYYDKSCLSLAHIYIVSTSGGILQGDRYRIDVTLDKNSTAHITTQGATRIYSMNSNNATQIINVTLKEDSYLEFIPDQIIPFRNSRFYQELDFNVHDTATLIYSEIITPGRIAMGESFEYDVCYLKTKARNQENKLRFLDIANIEPKKQKLTSFGILGNNDILGSVYILTKAENIQELYKEINSLISKCNEISGGVGIMNKDTGVLVRILGEETEQVKDIILKIVAFVRKRVIGIAFSGIRKN